MAKKEKADVNASAEALGKCRLAVFTENWMESTRLAAGLPNCYLIGWKKMQVVFSESDIERLISLNAPIRIFTEDAY